MSDRYDKPSIMASLRKLIDSKVFLNDCPEGGYLIVLYVFLYVPSGVIAA